MKKLLIGSALAALPFVGMAADPFQGVDLYYVNSEIEIGGGDDDGGGFGIGGLFRVGDQAYLDAEYQSAETDDFDIEIDQLRFGIGVHSRAMEGGLTFYGQGEYASIEVEGEDESGFGLHGGAILPLSPQFYLRGEIGYLTLDDFDGLEYTIGGAFDLSEQFGLFLDYRVTPLEDDNDNEVDFTDLKLGGRFLF